MSASRHRLWACWMLPSVAVPAGDILLSFLSPAAEEALPPQMRGALVSARVTSVAVREAARTLYFDLVARIGTTPLDEGGTFRRKLARAGGPSQWWFHRTSFKDCESDPAFDWLIAIQTIRAVAEREGAARLRLVGAPAPVAAALASMFEVEALETPATFTWRAVAALVTSRVRFGVRTWREVGAARRLTPPPGGRFDAALLGFWDWTVAVDQPSGSLRDCYFKGLPAALGGAGAQSVGWLVWLDPTGDPQRRGRSLRRVLAPAAGRPDVVVLQTLLRRREVLGAVADLSGIRTYLRLRRQPSFRAGLTVDGIDYYPAFSARLVTGFLDAQVPQCELVRTATARALKRYSPRLAFSSFEHFPVARAQYSSARPFSGTRFVAVQHASYSREKTFLHLHPAAEFAGEPDGCAVPVPDLVCAMGALGRELFLECGYPARRVLATGSPRYDDAAGPMAERQRTDAAPTILIVTTFRPDVELDMVEAAWLACRDLPVRLRLRCHPFRPLEREPRFNRLRGTIEISRRSLAEDLAGADLVMFTRSTVAEEALLRGIPTWQWLSPGFNGSALAETLPIPQFASVGALGAAIADFCANRSAFAPTTRERDRVVERLFFRLDGAAARRVAEASLRYRGAADGA